MKTLSISEGNQKLGKIPSFSLPALVTCPGKTAACAKACYANRGRSRMAGLGAWLKNYQTVRKEKASLRQVIHYCKAYRVPTFRVHVSGDFYSAAYVKAWIKIAKACPRTTFFGYTRSWRIDALRPFLEELRALPNVRLWASFDKFTGKAPNGWKSAFMALDDTTLPPSKPSLVFRVARKNIAKRLFNAAVCPVENGTMAGKSLTCQQCGICSR